MRHLARIDLGAPRAAAADARRQRWTRLIDAAIYVTAQLESDLPLNRNTQYSAPDLPGVRVPYILSS